MKEVIKNTLLYLLFGFVFAAISDIVIFLVCKYNNYNILNVTFVAGLIVLVVGMISATKSSPYGHSAITAMMESGKETNNNSVSIKKTLMKMALSSVSVIFAGVFLLVSSFIFK